MKRLMFVAVGVLGLAGAAVWAGPFDDVDVTYWAGSGSSEAVIVVDFGPGSNYAFGYRWDGNAMGWDALSAIDAAGDANVDATWWETYQCHFVNDLSYPGAVKCSGLSWGYYVSSDGNNWSESYQGVDREPLVAGAFQGWSWGDYDYDTWAHLRPPTTPRVPEPGTLAVLAMGAACIAARRRRRGET